MINPELLNAHAHDAKRVLSFATLRNCRDPSDPLRSLIILPVLRSANVIYCITCTLCKKLYIGETGRRLGDRFREHLRDVEKDDKNTSKPVARHFNLPNHSKQHMAICGLSLHQGSTESRTDAGLTLETSAFESLYGDQFTLSTQLIKPHYLVILPPTQHHSFFTNLPPLFK